MCSSMLSHNNIWQLVLLRNTFKRNIVSTFASFSYSHLYHWHGSGCRMELLRNSDYIVTTSTWFFLYQIIIIAVMVGQIGEAETVFGGLGCASLEEICYLGEWRRVLRIVEHLKKIEFVTNSLIYTRSLKKNKRKWLHSKYWDCINRLKPTIHTGDSIDDLKPDQCPDFETFHNVKH